MLVLFGVEAYCQPHPFHYEPILLGAWCSHLEMYAVASERLGLAAEFPPLHVISGDNDLGSLHHLGLGHVRC